MAKIKIKFTEDQVNLIKNLRFKQIKPEFFVDPCNDDVWIQNVGNGRFNIHNLIRKDKVQYANETFETVVCAGIRQLTRDLAHVDIAGKFEAGRC